MYVIHNTETDVNMINGYGKGGGGGGYCMY